MNNAGNNNEAFSFDDNITLFGETASMKGDDVNVINVEEGSDDNPETKPEKVKAGKKKAEPKVAAATPPSVDALDDDDDDDFPMFQTTDSQGQNQTPEGDEDGEGDGGDEEEKQPKKVGKKEDKPDEKPVVIPTDEVESKKFFTTFALNLKDRGILSMDIPEDAEFDEDEAYDLVDQEIDNRFDETVKGWMEELGPIGKDFLRYAKSGGRDVQGFLERYATTELNFTEDQLEDASIQEQFLRKNIKRLERLDDEDVEDRITFLKENGKLEKIAKKYFKLEDERTKKERENLLKEAEERETRNEESRKALVSSLNEVLKKDVVKEVKLSSDDKKTLTDYVVKPAVKVGNNKYISQLWADLQAAMKDPEKTILLAKTLKSNFDVSAFEKQGVSKQTKAVRTSLQHYSQQGGKNIKGVGAGGGVKDLAEYF